MNAPRLLELRKKYYTKMVSLSLTILVASFVGYAFLTTAWFSKNTTVASDSDGISIIANMYSLNITEGNVSPANISGDQSVASIDLDYPLYPISTPDCQNWYYPQDHSNTNTGFKKVSFSDNNLISESNGAFYCLKDSLGTAMTVSEYNSSGAGSTTYGAFSVANYTVYTHDGTMDVYLHPYDPISVSYTPTSGKDLDGAIRVALVVNGNIKLVYMPDADTEAHCIDSAVVSPPAYTLYTNVIGSTSGAITTNIDGSSDGRIYTAEPYTGSDEDAGAFVAGANAVKLGRVSYSDGYVPLNLTVYVWMEGTDPQATIVTASNENSPVSVRLNFAGVLIND